MGSVAGVLVAVAAGAQGVKFMSRMKADEELRESTTAIPLGEQHALFQTLACLVRGVYATDRGEKDASDHWTKSGYVEEVLEDGHYPAPDLEQVCRSGHCKVRLMLFRRRRRYFFKSKRQPTAGGGQDKTRIPKYVVAIRGTIQECLQDMVADFRIVCENLHNKEFWYVSVENMIRKIVQKHGEENVWVTGHSLGAAVGLLATRRLAIDDKIVLKTHLFNPPNCSSDVLVKKLVKSFGKGLNDVAERVLPGDAPRHMKEAVVSVAKPVASVVKAGLRYVGSKMDPEYCSQMASECEDLLKIGWTPDLYVNPKDSICSEYESHFKKYIEAPEASTPASSSLAAPIARSIPVSILRIDSRSYQLIPAAVLYSNHWASGFPEAHNLDQWFRFPIKDLRVYNCWPVAYAS